MRRFFTNEALRVLFVDQGIVIVLFNQVMSETNATDHNASESKIQHDTLRRHAAEFFRANVVLMVTVLPF